VPKKARILKAGRVSAESRRKGIEMKHLCRHAVLAALMLAGTGAAVAGVNVSYAKPEQFADVPWNERERQAVLQEFNAHFAKLATRLPPGQDLTVEVLDIDLAGYMRPARWGVNEIRVVRGGADWPHMRLRYTVTENGQVVKSGVEDLQSMSYTQRPTRYFVSDTLRYEKQMLDEWFRDRVAAR
jgi:hypothetical protein